jgi:hypothetical protein
MNINRKIAIASVAFALLPLNISTSPAIASIFRPSCTENTRGIGIVNATAARNEVRLEWQTPNEVPVQGITVCYKKSWSLSGKCDNDDRIVSVGYSTSVIYGDIIISDLRSDTCYKFAVYGTNPGESGRGRLIGEQKIKTRS